MWETPFCLVIKLRSAPEKTSCQRRPSVITKKTFCASCLAACADTVATAAQAITTTRILPLIKQLLLGIRCAHRLPLYQCPRFRTGELSPVPLDNPEEYS